MIKDIKNEVWQSDNLLWNRHCPKCNAICSCNSRKKARELYKRKAVCRDCGRIPTMIASKAAAVQRRIKTYSLYDTAVKLIISEYDSQERSIKPYDESLHWSNHNEVMLFNTERNRKSSLEYYHSMKHDPEFHKLTLERAKAQFDKMPRHERFIKNLRSRMWKFVNQGDSQSMSKYIGCSHDECREHIKNQFTLDMSWDNYGTYWSVDHIIPCTAFNQWKPSHRSVCFHYYNLQPMLYADNIKKSNYIRRNACINVLDKMLNDGVISKQLYDEIEVYVFSEGLKDPDKEVGEEAIQKELEYGRIRSQEFLNRSYASN